MCGISVLFNRNKITSHVYNEFAKSLQKINHRGPDDEGVVLINTTTNDFKIVKTNNTHSKSNNLLPIDEIDIEQYNLILGHKRLSIIDLSVNGHQPMQAPNGNWIVFNGEIYNYVELKEELKKYNCVFYTNSDTEVILEAYRIWGTNCFNKFNGMWSICIWDASQKIVLISNDRFGVKPLYYHENEEGFSLVSETKQFQSYNNITKKINHQHLNEFAKFEYVDIDDGTMYEAIYRFKKSHFIVINPLNYRLSKIRNEQKQYCFLKKTAIQRSKLEVHNQFRELLYDAVRIRMRADVDFGFALSGGIDSSSILYTARNIIKTERKDTKLLGFSAVFPGYNEDESKFVKIVENDLPCKTVYSNALSDFNFSNFEKHIYHQDEPVHGTSYFAQWSVYKIAQQSQIKILFNGQGSDEVFAGYHHHFYRYCRQLLVRGKLIEYFGLVRQFAELKSISTKYIHKTVFNELKLKSKILLGIKKFDHKIVKYWNSIDTLDEMLLRDFDTFQLPTYLRADDRDSMSFSIESRHPFMDYRLVEFGYSLPNTMVIKNGWQKHIIRESMFEMPDEIRYRKDKKGFTSPQSEWIEKYRSEFESNLVYNELNLGTKYPAKDTFFNYVLGTWLKVNNFN
jgi:asparagine synthase (glutamine-hydrolysing)